MGHRVPNHKSKCRNPHGHRYRLEMTVTGDLIDDPGDSSEGMVIDFGDIKELMKVHIHDVVDHGFMYYRLDTVMTHVVELTEQMNGEVGAEPFLAIPVNFIPTAENIVKWCYDQIWEYLPGGVDITKMRLYETPNSWADYTP